MGHSDFTRQTWTSDDVTQKINTGHNNLDVSSYFLKADEAERPVSVVQTVAAQLPYLRIPKLRIIWSRLNPKKLPV